MLAHVLAVMLLTVSPRLHHWVHPDADDDDHDCAVVLFLHGGGDAGPVPLSVPVFVRPAAEGVASMPATAFVPAVGVANGVLEHAPPSRG